MLRDYIVLIADGLNCEELTPTQLSLISKDIQNVRFGAPFVMSGKCTAGPNNDLWSLGALMYFMATGKNFSLSQDIKVLRDEIAQSNFGDLLEPLDRP